MGKDLKGKELGVGFSQRKDGSYSYRYTDRFGDRKSLYDANLARLRKNAKLAESKDTLKMNCQGNDRTLNEIFDDAMNIYRVDELKESTIISYKMAYDKHIRDNLGKRKINTVTPKDIKITFNKLGEEYSQSICGTVRACFLTIYDIAVLENIVPYNVIHSLKVKSKKEKKKVDALTLEEQELFVKAAEDSFYYNLYMFVLNSGLRVGEVIGLSMNNIDLDKRIVHVKRALYYKGGKGEFSNGSKYRFDKPKNNSERDVPINDTLYDIIIEQMYTLKLLKRNRLQSNNKPYKKVDQFDDLLFLSRTGTPVSRAMITTDLKRICRNIKKKNPNFKTFGIHVLRHTFATRCYEAGMKETTLQQIMGHKRLAVTMDTYVSKEVSNDSTNVIDYLFAPKNGGVDVAYLSKLN